MDTLGPDVSYLHIVSSGSVGETLGVHLRDGSLIHTTADIVLVDHDLNPVMVFVAGRKL